MATSKKALAKKSNKALADKDLFNAMQQDAGKGLENADKDSFAVPFVLCLQGLSPQLETVDGAKPGLFINSVTNEMMKSPIVIPVYFERQFLRWVDRSAGGGFKGAYSSLDVEQLIASGEAVRSDDGLTIRIGDSESLSDTRQHYVLLLDKNGQWYPAVVACASTQIKKSKNWITQINNFRIGEGENSFNPPSWSRRYVITSKKESNQKGEWYGIVISPDTSEDPNGLVDKATYDMGQQFYDQIVKGKVIVQHEDLDGGSAPAEDDENF